MDIKNWLPIDARLATAGQPTEEQLREVAAAGYTAVVNLGLLDQGYSLPDEAGLVRDLGMNYRHIPVIWQAPTPDDLRAFVAQMDAWSAERVFVHCAANYRVSAFMALYGELRLGWSRERADAHARTFWELDDVWRGFLEAGRAS